MPLLIRPLMPLSVRHVVPYGGAETRAHSEGVRRGEVVAPCRRVCDDQGNSYEVVLQLQSGESSTQGNGILVRYTSEGRSGTVALPDRVVMCVRPERPECA